MNYKKIIRNQDTRLQILKFLDFIPDELMVKLQYKIKTGHKLNLRNPQRYSEKIQWYKLFYRNPEMKKYVDKYLVREYLEDKGLGHILNDLYGIYATPEEINFQELPDEFIIKLTSGSGGNIIVKNKNNIDQKVIIDQLNEWIEKRPGRVAGEWAYPEDSKIIIERLLERNIYDDLPDYKFFCFNGKVEYLYVMVDYVDNHEEGKCSFYTKDFEKLDYRRSEFEPIDYRLEKPINFDKMIEYAEILSEDFPHVRVDFYHSDHGEIIFGELTFYNGSGYTSFTPDKFDYILGDKFVLPRDSR
ncbi:ATP-grasp fold amidoligase family protein [Aerococcus urinaeequi]|uniref:ATP-grasp fold amidoligase family protein n=1 Tax=Aerococcus urinaeequi TaxID=51665 RepID=UPI003B3BB421